jgi:hypothetical protein
MTPRRSSKNRRFGEKYHLHRQGDKNRLIVFRRCVPRLIFTANDIPTSPILVPPDGGDTLLLNIGS